MRRSWRSLVVNKRQKPREVFGKIGLLKNVVPSREDSTFSPPNPYALAIMSDRSTSFETFIGILREAIEHPEVCLRVVRRGIASAGAAQTPQHRIASAVPDANHVAAIFSNLCHGGETSVRVTSKGIRLRHFYRLEEGDLALVTRAKDFALARSGFDAMFARVEYEVKHLVFLSFFYPRQTHDVVQGGGSFETANVKWSHFCADGEVDKFFGESAAAGYVFHFFKNSVARAEPRSFYSAAHAVATVLREFDARSAEVWMGFLFSCTFPSIVHVRVARCATELQHLQVWRVYPKNYARYHDRLRRLGQRHLHFTGQRDVAAALLRCSMDEEIRRCFAALEGGGEIPVGKAALYAAWVLDANPLAATRRRIVQAKGWRTGCDWIPFVSPELFREPLTGAKRRRNDALTRRLCLFASVRRSLANFPEALDVPTEFWMRLREEQTREALEAMLAVHPHLFSAARRVLRDARDPFPEYLVEEAARVARSVRDFLKGNGDAQRAHNIPLRAAVRYDPRAHEPEVRAGGASTEVVQWLRERGETLLAFVLEEGGAVTWMDARATAAVAWKRLSAATAEHVRVVRGYKRVMVCVEADFATALAHASSLRVPNPCALDHLFADGRFDALLEALFVERHGTSAAGALARARATDDALGTLAEEAGEGWRKGERAMCFSDFFACEPGGTRCVVDLSKVFPR